VSEDVPLASRPVRITTTDWVVSFVAVSVAAKMALAILRAADGGGHAWARPAASIAFLYDDVRMGLIFALVAAALARFDGRRWARWGLPALYGALTFWMAFNIPVARQLSSPMTYAFLHATGSALGDSIASYATPLNLGVPATLWLAGLALPRVWRGRWRPSRRALAVGGAVAALWLLIGPAAISRIDTLGLHRNAILALVETTLDRRDPGGETLPSLDGPECRPHSPAAADLSDLAGVARDRNIVWVILESIGAPALGAYGAPQGRTPHLDALAANAVVFDNAYAAYPESIKGLFSILCARTPPPGTEASQYTAARLPCPAVAQELARAGLRTGLFHSGWFAYLGMDAVVGGRGFQQLQDAGAIASPHRSSFGVDDRATARKLLAFVDAQPGERFFAVFMPIAGHHPYHAPGDAPRPFPEANDHEAYANEVHVADDAFGLLRAGLTARGLDDRTIYVVIGDHGEAFREHEGNVAHALFLYEENLRVPLLVAAPGLFPRQRRAPQLASLIDLAPTTLALAGAAIPGGYQGASLLTGRPRVVRFFTEQGVRRAGLRDERWKLILDQDGNRAQLFDLQADPAERNDLASAQPALVSRYRACLAR
jgi:hypothetical protein